MIYYSFPLAWDDAADLAKQMKARGAVGQLATITSPLEHEMIVDRFSKMNSHFGRFDVWTGLSQPTDQSVWQWTTGEPLTFKIWHAGEPQNSEGHAAVYEIRRNDQGKLDWRWAARPKTNKSVQHMLVEYQLAEH